MTRRLAERSLVVLGTRAPAALYGAAGWVAPLATGRVTEEATVEDIERVFPGLSPAAAARLRREMAASALRSRILAGVLSHTAGGPAYPRVVVESAEGAEREQAIMLTWHIGPIGAVGAVLRDLPRAVAAMHRVPWAMPANLIDIRTGTDVRSRAAAFQRALSAVREGASACVLADHAEGIDVHVLGCPRRFTRGPFALARLTGAPIVPVLARWAGAHVRCRIGPALLPAEDERRMAAEAALWLEAHLLEHPEAADPRLVLELARPHR